MKMQTKMMIIVCPAFYIFFCLIELTHTHTHTINKSETHEKQRKSLQFNTKPELVLPKWAN